MCPANAVARLITLMDWHRAPEDKVFGGWAMGIPDSRIGGHSLRSGGATAMRRAEYDIEVIKRLGRWKSTATQK